jgi:hypothetical protein
MGTSLHNNDEADEAREGWDAASSQLISEPRSLALC